MSTHNICFHGEIRKILCGYPLLSVARVRVFSVCATSYDTGTKSEGHQHCSHKNTN